MLNSTSPARPMALETALRGRTTLLPVSVRPAQSASDFLLRPSTSTRCVRPISASLRALESGVKVSITSRSRRCLTVSGTSSTSARWACVFSRREKANMKARSNRTSRSSESVSWWSSSVSPQKPEMKSEERAALGRSSRTLETSSTYAWRSYPRRIASSTAEEPDCAGMCRLSHALGWAAITRSSSSGKSFGWGEVKRKRTSG
mmetsp:Transcript_5194/g.16295  ORF Transcript_5194/g.16295 Transcript_5194/m.16295 type:complete len:204 (-) Transcript_5194:392-1003(-)